MMRAWIKGGLIGILIGFLIFFLFTMFNPSMGGDLEVFRYSQNILFTSLISLSLIIGLLIERKKLNQIKIRRTR